MLLVTPLIPWKWDYIEATYRGISKRKNKQRFPCFELSVLIVKFLMHIKYVRNTVAKSDKLDKGMAWNVAKMPIIFPTELEFSYYYFPTGNEYSRSINKWYRYNVHGIRLNIKNKHAYAIFICESSPFQIGRYPKIVFASIYRHTFSPLRFIKNLAYTHTHIPKSSLSIDFRSYLKCSDTSRLNPSMKT